jgi:molybdopterin-guanine dinucleotide biosynthesis protein A
MESAAPAAVILAASRAFILSGGAARRAGGVNKSLMLLEGRPIVEHQLDRLRPLFGTNITVVTDRAEDFAPYSLSTIADVDRSAPPDERSPLRGLAHALASAGDWCFLLAADMPWPEPELIRAQAAWLARACDAEAPRPLGLVLSSRGILQPFHAFYHASLAAPAQAALASADRSVRGWIRAEASIRVCDVETFAASISPAARPFDGFNAPPHGGPGPLTP